MALIEELGIALVREYLSRKGYKKTLASLETEAPRSQNSIGNRSVLTRELGVAQLMKNNKAQSQPYRTIVEVIVHHFVTTPTSQATPPTHKTPPTSKKSRKADVLSDGNPITTVATPTELTKHRKAMTSPVDKTCLTGSRNRGELDKRIRHSIEQNVITQEEANDGLVICQDLEDVESDIDHSSFGNPPQVIAAAEGEMISLSSAQRLREVTFGSATTHSFNEEWRGQGFIYNSIQSLSYGLIQHKGGPCGVLACVQAHILKALLCSVATPAAVAAESTYESMQVLFQYLLYNPLLRLLQLSVSQQRELLVTALSEILWRAGDRKRATVALKCWRYSTTTGTVRSKLYWPDHLTEQLVLYQFENYESLKKFIEHSLEQYTSSDKDNCGVIVYLYSVILSRGTERLRADFDDPHNTLIGAHGYCTQELINLFLTGSATSNAFDGNLFIDSGQGQPLSEHRLKGLECQSDIGFLTLFEHYGTCTIGDYYKSPKYPVWVVCSESHFTVLFSLSVNLVSNRAVPAAAVLSKFELHYYDGLGCFTEPIILTIDTTGNDLSAATDDESSGEPPLELCIRTKWKGAKVKWLCDRIF